MKRYIEKIPLWFLRVVAILTAIPLIYLAWEFSQHEGDSSDINPQEVRALRVGSQAADFAVPAIRVAAAADFRLSSLKGHPVILHFWATWCGPCIHELPELLKLAQKIRKEGFSLVAVAVDEDWQVVDRFFTKYPHLMPMREQMVLILDPQGVVANLYGVSRFPETLLINQAFVIDNKMVGAQPWLSPQMQRYLDRLKGKEEGQ